MKIGILGTGMVGETLGTHFVEQSHDVCMGSRTFENPNATAWVAKAGPRASHGTFADAATFGHIVFFCTKGEATLDIARSVGPATFADKTVVDVSNPLDFSVGKSPSLLICNTTSLGEELQKVLPQAHVVKTLNIVNCEVMVDPRSSGGDPTMLVSGNDSNAKTEITALLKSMGWVDVLDLGDITTARASEMLLPLWLGLMKSTGGYRHAFKILRPTR